MSIGSAKSRQQAESKAGHVWEWLHVRLHIQQRYGITMVIGRYNIGGFNEEKISLYKLTIDNYSQDNERKNPEYRRVLKPDVTKNIMTFDKLQKPGQDLGTCEAKDTAQ